MSDSVDKQGPRPIDGLTSKGGRFAVVASRFNAPVVDRLLEGALEAFRRTGTRVEDVRIVRVPGAFELPLMASHLIESNACDAVIALGCVIRGETAHFEHVSRAAADGLRDVSLQYRVPVGFGVLTTDTVDQAMDRSGGADGTGANHGFDAAMAAIEMLDRLKER